MALPVLNKTKQPAILSSRQPATKETNHQVGRIKVRLDTPPEEPRSKASKIQKHHSRRWELWGHEKTLWLVAWCAAWMDWEPMLLCRTEPMLATGEKWYALGHRYRCNFLSYRCGVIWGMLCMRWLIYGELCHSCVSWFVTVELCFFELIFVLCRLIVSLPI